MRGDCLLQRNLAAYGGETTNWLPLNAFRVPHMLPSEGYAIPGTPWRTCHDGMIVPGQDDDPVCTSRGRGY